MFRKGTLIILNQIYNNLLSSEGREDGAKRDLSPLPPGNRLIQIYNNILHLHKIIIYPFMC